LGITLKEDEKEEEQEDENEDEESKTLEENISPSLFSVALFCSFFQFCFSRPR
jgi:hypothetical protein